jgi:hypothetical protein
MAAPTFIRPGRPAGRRSAGDRISRLLTADGDGWAYKSGCWPWRRSAACNWA